LELELGDQTTASSRVMSAVNSLGKLRPGAWRIIQALAEGPKTFSELAGATGLSHTGLAKYLEELSPLLTRDQGTRRYALFWRPLPGAGDYSLFDSKDLRDVQLVARHMDSVLAGEGPMDGGALDAFIDLAFAFFAGKVLLGLSDAVRASRGLEDALARIRRLIEGYVAPYLGFMAVYCMRHSPDAAERLEGAGLRLIRRNIREGTADLPATLRVRAKPAQGAERDAGEGIPGGSGPE